MRETSFHDLIETYDLLLIDAFGVLVRSDGAMDGAVELVAALNAAGTPYYIVTNDASRTNATVARRFQRLGMDIPEARVITSGSLTARFIEEHDLGDEPCLAMASDDVLAMLDDTNITLIEPGDTSAPVAAFFLCSVPRIGLIDALEDVVTTLLATIDAGHTPHLVLPNPDLIYPRTADSYGLTAGAFAHLILGVLEDRYPEQRFSFRQLGKPDPYIFEEAFKRHFGRQDAPRPTDPDAPRAVMIGDQLPTDIRGALAFGIDAALIHTGITRLDNHETLAYQPTWLLRGLH